MPAYPQKNCCGAKIHQMRSARPPFMCQKLSFQRPILTELSAFKYFFKKIEFFKFRIEVRCRNHLIQYGSVIHMRQCLSQLVG